MWISSSVVRTWSTRAVAIAVAIVTASTLAVTPNPSAARPIGATFDGPGQCANDVLRVEMSPQIAERVERAVKLVEPGARMRAAARLVFPCGFIFKKLAFGNVVVQGAGGYRRYAENNPFGFDPPFGFSDERPKSYDMAHYDEPSADILEAPDCPAQARQQPAALMLCAGFGSDTAFFGVGRAGGRHRIAHYALGSAGLKEDFEVASTTLPIEAIYFLPPPDAPGGTITLVLRDNDSLYRVRIDTPRG